MQRLKLKSNSLLFVLISLVCGANAATGAINVTGSEITKRSFSVTVTGDLPSVAPETFANAIWVVDPDASGAPYFIEPAGDRFSDFEEASNASFDGAQTVSSADALGSVYAGEGTIRFSFESLEASEGFSGTLSASWSYDILDPSVPNSLELYWGDFYGLGEDFEGGLETGILLGSLTVVPEPSAAALILGLGAMGVAACRRRAKTWSEV